MRALDLLEMLTNDAKEQRLRMNKQIRLDSHMNDHDGSNLTQEAIDAILVAFINQIGSRHCIDYALHTVHLREDS